MKNICFIVLLSFVLALVSCSKGDSEKTVYTITFDSDGGSPTPPAQSVVAGETVTAPTTNPAKTGYVFMFWHLTGVSTAFNFGMPINNDITLQAQWKEASTVEYLQVSWELNGGAWPSSGDNHATQVAKGGTLAEPAAPTKAGNTLDAWYKEAALTTKINFPYDVSAITSNFTLYAKWTTGSSGGISLNKTLLELRTTDRERLTATGVTGITWSTSNKDVAVIDNQGVVTATGAGTAVITASAGGKSAKCDISVEPSVFAGIGTVIWKNGEKIEVKNYNAPKTINSIFVYGGNIYITGTKTDITSGGGTSTEYSQAVVIKVECAIKDEANTLIFTDQIMERKGNASYGEDMFISSNGDIYIVGYELAKNEYNNYYRRAVLWKNGKLQPVLSNSSVSQNAVASSVFVSGNDVYVAGNNGYWVNDVVWKNGQPEILNSPPGDIDRLKAYSVFVFDGNVYVAGAAYFNHSSYTIPKQVLWKNNVPTVLDTDDTSFAELYSVFVSGNDVYAAGSKGLWKNNAKLFNESIKDVCVYANDVYVAGNDGLWINAVKQSWGAGNSIVVK